MRQTGMNDYGFGARLRREIAFVAYAHDLAVQAQSEKDLRGRGKQGHNSHEDSHSNTSPGPCHQATAREHLPRGTDLLVQKVFAANLVEGLEHIRPASNDFLRRDAIFDLLHGIVISH